MDVYGSKTLCEVKGIFQTRSSDTFSLVNIKWFQQFSIKKFPQWTTIKGCAISIK